ncbi:hypothetical protein OL548_06100 [Lysinibacillus sp. MHQ-1]|nr:hypothetical protein OL548_06100 [Lysinibacillus sp. MHQ-1]
MKINDVILRTVTKAVVFIILTLGVYLFFAGHHAPGGGFIGGLVLASGIVLLYLAYDIETVHKGMPFDFKKGCSSWCFACDKYGNRFFVFLMYHF